MWVKGFRTFNTANQDTTSAVEGYHAALKYRLNNIKKLLVGRRIDWLINVLTHFVLIYFQQSVAKKLSGFARNIKLERAVEAAIVKVSLNLVAAHVP